MMLEGSNTSAAIRWVREDLDECLETVRENLEAFAEDMSRREPLVAVQEELERLNLTFLTMQQRGASILTDEMIAVGGHMLHNGSADCQESLNALTDAVVVLPSYLDRLQAGHEDLPILLLPSIAGALGLPVVDVRREPVTGPCYVADRLLIRLAPDAARIALQARAGAGIPAGARLARLGVASLDAALEGSGLRFEPEFRGEPLPAARSESASAGECTIPYFTSQTLCVAGGGSWTSADATWWTAKAPGIWTSSWCTLGTCSDPGHTEPERW